MSNIYVDTLTKIKEILVADSWITTNFENPSRDIYIYDKEAPSEIQPCIELHIAEDPIDFFATSKWKHTVAINVVIMQKIYDIEEAAIGTSSGKIGIYELAYQVWKILSKKTTMEMAIGTGQMLISKPMRITFATGSYEFQGRIYFLKVATIGLYVEILENIE